jgi:membrane protease subunit (stomatin/prohibitin family)
MSIFKNDNETAYTGGKKHWADVIKNTGDGNLLIWRQPEEDFNTNTTLFVMPGEEAIFIKDGQIETVSQNGKYNLKTDNYPFISRIRNMFTGGVSSYNCVVYFVRKAHSQQILWGTPSPIQVRDNVLGMMTNVQANGSFKIQIDNSVKFLKKLIGSNIQFETQDGLNNYFFNQFIQYITDSLQEAIENSNEEIYRTFKKKTFLAEDVIAPKFQPVLDDYGIKLVNFSIAELKFVNDELRRTYETRIQQIGLDAREKVISEQAAAQGKKSHFDILGEKYWKEQQQADILKDLANNQGAGGTFATAGAGLGMGVAAGGVFGGMAQNLFGNGHNNNGFSDIDDSPFTTKETPREDPEEALEKLKRMLDKDYISQAEYDAKKQEILNRM